MWILSKKAAKSRILANQSFFPIRRKLSFKIVQGEQKTWTFKPIKQRENLQL